MDNLATKVQDEQEIINNKIENVFTKLMFLVEDQKISTHDEIDQQFKPFEKRIIEVKIAIRDVALAEGGVKET